MKNSISMLAAVHTKLSILKCGANSWGAALLLAGAWFVLASPASAIVYTGTRVIGPTTVDLSITTDDTIGSLTAGNFTDWLIQVTNPTNPVNDNFLFTPVNSDLIMLGTAPVASSTALTFDFSSSPQSAFEFMVKPGYPANFQHFYCVGAQLGCTTNNPNPNSPGEEVVFAQAAGRVVYYATNPSGVVTLASAPDAPGDVPEPASWALMVVGFGALGAAMRRRPNLQLSA